MGNDSFTEVTSESWLSRIGGAFKGILFGIILIVGCICLLWWNEGRAVQTAKSLDEGAAAVVTVDNNAVNPENEGALVHLTGNAVTEDILKDDLFDISVNGVKLRREVEMYQWKETKDEKTEKKLGGSTETTTTYNYEKTWSSNLIKSNDFKKREGHENPAEFKYKGFVSSAKNVSVGAFKLSSGQIAQLNNFQAMEVEKVDTTKIPGAKLGNNEIFIGANSSNPQVGDMKVRFQVVNPSEISLVAKQKDNTFEAYQTEAGDALLMVSLGNVSSENMFSKAHSSNNTMTWILRLVGFVFMAGGFSLILRPISVIGDVVPFIGNLLEVGIGLISGVASFSISFTTIAIAWIYYRPVLGISLLVVGGAAAFFIIKKSREKKKLKVETEAAPVA